MLKLTKFPPPFGGNFTFNYTSLVMKRFISHVHCARSLNRFEIGSNLAENRIEHVLLTSWVGNNFSDGFSLSVPGTCFGNIGKQVLFPYVSVPLPCFRKDAPPLHTSFLSLDRASKKKVPPKKITCSCFHGIPRATRGWRMTMCSLCMRQLGLFSYTQRRRNSRSTTSSGTTHWWTKELLQVNLLQVVETKVLQRSGRFRSDSSMG